MDFDLEDPGLPLRDDVVDDQRPLYDFLRRHAPVWRVPGQDTYLVSDPDLIRSAVARPGEGAAGRGDIVPLLSDPLPAPGRAPTSRSVVACTSASAPTSRAWRRIALERLLAATSRIALDPERLPRRRRSTFLRRHASLPVLIAS